MVHCPHVVALINALMDAQVTLTAVGQHPNAIQVRVQKPACVYQMATVPDRLRTAIRILSHLNALNASQVPIVIRSPKPNAEHI